MGRDCWWHMTIHFSGSKDSAWSPLRRFCVQLTLAGLSLLAYAEGSRETGADTACTRDEVLAHVLAQFRLYGPLSRNREYFGFIFRSGPEIQSTVVQGSVCGFNHACGVNTEPAARGIPPGAKVLGEWHTHPHRDGSRILSIEDVRGAYRNRRIRCYSAYYSQPNGDIHTWDVNTDSVPTAMNSRSLLGNYRDPANVPVIIAASVSPGPTCLSTSTNAHTADTTKKSCRRSPTNP